ncbi:MAG: hypothetical protein AAB875_06670 [Patescibacteria group bacterium]
MADEELDLELESEESNINKVEKRIKSLSEKVKLTSEERDELKGLNDNLTAEKHTLSKERDFYKGFNQVSTKYPGASDYQDKILEKVNAGYDVEDATISILAKEGKYTPAQVQVENEKVAGGSASTGITGKADKTPGEMSQDERRSALMDLESKGELHL